MKFVGFLFGAGLALGLAGIVGMIVSPGTTGTPVVFTACIAGSIGAIVGTLVGHHADRL